MFLKPLIRILVLHQLKEEIFGFVVGIEWSSFPYFQQYKLTAKIQCRQGMTKKINVFFFASDG
jgi:hypothetical protein